MQLTIALRTKKIKKILNNVSVGTICSVTTSPVFEVLSFGIDSDTGPVSFCHSEEGEY